MATWLYLYNKAQSFKVVAQYQLILPVPSMPLPENRKAEIRGRWAFAICDMRLSISTLVRRGFFNKNICRPYVDYKSTSD